MQESLSALVGEIEMFDRLIAAHKSAISNRIEKIEAMFVGQKYEHRKTKVVREIQHVFVNQDPTEVIIYWQDGTCGTPSGGWLQSYIDLKNLTKSYKKV